MAKQSSSKPAPANKTKPSKEGEPTSAAAKKTSEAKVKPIQAVFSKPAAQAAPSAVKGKSTPVAPISAAGKSKTAAASAKPVSKSAPKPGATSSGQAASPSPTAAPGKAAASSKTGKAGKGVPSPADKASDGGKAAPKAEVKTEVKAAAKSPAKTSAKASTKVVEKEHQQGGEKSDLKAPGKSSEKIGSKVTAKSVDKKLPVAVVPESLKDVRPVLSVSKEAVRASIIARRAKPAKPVPFSMDEVLQLAKLAVKSPEEALPIAGPVIATKSGKTAPLPASALEPVKPTTVRAASLADILGFNPKARTSHAENEEASVPEKFKRYYKLLIELRNHVTGQVDQHSEETLKRSAKEDSGDLSSYGTDGGTDSFDRDFALSLVANEQEALTEIEAAIQRIRTGNYGVCEHTGKLIPKERLLAVPFTRYTAEAMKEVEKTRYKVRGQSGIFGEGEEGGPKIEADDGGE